MCKPLLVLLIVLCCVQKTEACSKSSLHSTGVPDKSAAGYPFISGVLHFTLRGVNQINHYYSHPHQCKLYTKSGHSDVVILYPPWSSFVLTKVCKKHQQWNIHLWRTHRQFMKSPEEPETVIPIDLTQTLPDICK